MSEVGRQADVASQPSHFASFIRARITLYPVLCSRFHDPLSAAKASPREFGATTLEDREVSGSGRGGARHKKLQMANGTEVRDGFGKNCLIGRCMRLIV